MPEQPPTSESYHYGAVTTADLPRAGQFGWEYVSTFYEERPLPNNSVTSSSYGIIRVPLHLVRRRAESPIQILEAHIQLLSVALNDTMDGCRAAMRAGLAEAERMRQEIDLVRTADELETLTGVSVWFLTTWLLHLCRDAGKHESRFSLLEVD